MPLISSGADSFEPATAMSVWTFVKLLAAAAVIGAIAFTGMFAYHVAVRPLSGIFKKLIPNPKAVIGNQPDADFAKMVDSTEMPDVDPGENIFQKAHELIALGQLPQAREKLNTLINTFPTSSSAPSARHIVGEMNLDDLLSNTQMEGKQTHIVKRGDSFLGIAAHYQTTLDSIMHLNGLQELKNLQPGEELIVMPLEFNLLIEPQRKAISLWSGQRFICEYPILHIESSTKLVNQRTTIQTKAGQLDLRRSRPDAKPKTKPGNKPPAKSNTKSNTKAEGKSDGKSDAKSDGKSDGKGGVAPGKSLQLAKLQVLIRADAPEDTGARGIFLSPEDIEELFLLTRTGNAVEIRLNTR